jgi:hypothetical protein
MYVSHVFRLLLVLYTKLLGYMFPDPRLRRRPESQRICRVQQRLVADAAERVRA